MKRQLSLLVPTGVAVLAWAGCASEPSVQPPPMPSVGPAIQRVTVEANEAVARARDAVRRDDLPSAIATVGMVAADQRAIAFHQLAAAVAREDPARATRLALALPPGAAQNDAIAVAAETMAARDRQAAVKWAAAIAPAGPRHVAMAALAERWVAGDPATGVHEIETLADQPGKAELLQLAAGAWARHDVEAALRWAASLPDDLRIRQTTGIAFELAQTAPERAAEIANSLPENRDRWLLISAIAQTWIARNPQAAQAWLRSLPAGPAHDAALAGFASATGPVQPRRSVAVQGRYRSPGRLPGGGAPAGDVTALAPGLERSDALRREFERRLQEGPARAAQWLSSLPAPDVTDDMLLRLARDWYRQDPNAATLWLETNVPSSVRRDQILREAQR